MRIIIFCGLLLMAVACTKKDKAAQTPAEKGRALYAMHCTACHNANPKIDGALGPMVFGSSQELLERRIIHGDYPAGYTPKRTTKQMTRLPALKDDIPALHAYLNTP